MKRLFVLATCFLISTSAFAKMDSDAVKCVENFLNAFEKVQTYKTVMHKVEYGDKKRIIHDETVEVVSKKLQRFVSYTYLNEGSTGIRNNGMRLEYNGDSKLKINFGNAHGLGNLVHGPAVALIGDHIQIDHELVLEDELFTINRAGFGVLASIIRKNLNALKKSEKGGVQSITPGSCSLRYTKHTDESEEITISPTDSIFDLEDRMGTFAYMIFFENRFELARIYNLFHRKEPMKLTVPHWFLDFEVDFDKTTKMPTRFTLYRDGEKLGDYRFTDTVLNVK